MCHGSFSRENLVILGSRVEKGYASIDQSLEI